MTRKEQADQKQAILEAVIYQWTGLRIEEQRTFLYQSGLEFLQIMEGNEGEYFKKMESNKSFWNWWRGKWYSRDHAFVIRELPKLKALKSRYIEPYYKAYHNLHQLMDETPIETSYYQLVALTNI